MGSWTVVVQRPNYPQSPKKKRESRRAEGSKSVTSTGGRFNRALPLVRRISGWTSERGTPFTLITPLPFLTWATAVAVFCAKNGSVASSEHS